MPIDPDPRLRRLHRPPLRGCRPTAPIPASMTVSDEHLYGRRRDHQAGSPQTPASASRLTSTTIASGRRARPISILRSTRNPWAASPTDSADEAVRRRKPPAAFSPVEKWRRPPGSTGRPSPSEGKARPSFHHPPLERGVTPPPSRPSPDHAASPSAIVIFLRLRERRLPPSPPARPSRRYPRPSALRLCRPGDPPPPPRPCPPLKPAAPRELGKQERTPASAKSPASPTKGLST